MARSSALSLFAFKGIRVQLHWSFPLLIIWVAATALMGGMRPVLALQQVAYVLVLFACVVLHEFGHALTAMRYGIRTRNITLYPIGGVASLERIPEKPAQELAVALAGPAVNLVIATVVGLLLWATGHAVLLAEPGERVGLGALAAVVVAGNIGLLLFNLVPAFPMDGGRVLRALLALRMDRVRATRIAAMLGRIIAVGFIIAALYWKQPVLGLIGLFVILGASAEKQLVETQGALRGVRVRDVMRTRFWTLPPEALVQQAADELLAGGDHHLVVVEHGRFVQVVPRSAIIAAVQAGRQADAVGALPGAAPVAVSPDAIVNDAMVRMNDEAQVPLPVVEAGRLVGILEMDNLSEYVALRGQASSGVPGA
jgi:Zn-dependent protease